MKYCIKERDNFQSPVYYVACGKLSNAAAKRKEKSLAGCNTMHAFDTLEAYEARLAELRATGANVHPEFGQLKPRPPV